MSGKKSLGSRIAASVRGKSASGGSKEPTEYQYGDIVLFGMSGVGKTAIADRFVNNYFTELYSPTESKRTYEVNALIETEKDKDKKAMVMKKSFKKSVMGNSRPPLKSKETMKVKSVLSVRRSGEAGPDDSRAYQEGKARGLKSLMFNLVDTPPDMAEMEPVDYQATISNAKGFLLVCSFDKNDSLEAVEQRYEDIKRVRHGLDAETPVVLIANKRDLEEGMKVMDDLDVSEVAARLHIKWCVSDMSSPEGVVEMSALMLNEINIAATQEEYLDSLPEDQYMYVDEMVE